MNINQFNQANHHNFLSQIIQESLNSTSDNEFKMNHIYNRINNSDTNFNNSDTNFNNKLTLYFHSWHQPNLPPFAEGGGQFYLHKYFNNLIVDEDKNIVMYGGPKIYDSNRDNFNQEMLTTLIGNDNLSECKFYQANEGTIINVFNHENKWYYTTKKLFDMFQSKFESNNTHGNMFKEIVNDFSEFESKLKSQYTYQFVLIHRDNKHLLTDEDNYLELINVRDRDNNHSIVDNSDDHFIAKEYPDFVKKQLEVDNKFESLYLDDDLNQENKVNSQGLIIKFKDLIFRLYNDKYAKAIRVKPKFHSKQEELFHKFQKNQLGKDLTLEKTLTMNAYNFISIMLFRLMNHFTKFESNPNNGYKFTKTNLNDFEKIQNMNGSCSLIRNLNKLQNLPFTIKKIKFVDFNQVKYHLKYYCYHRELHELFTFCYNKEIMDLVKYQHSGMIEDKLSQFHKLRLKRKNKKSNNLEEQVKDSILSDINDNDPQELVD